MAMKGFALLNSLPSFLEDLWFVFSHNHIKGLMKNIYQYI